MGSVCVCELGAGLLNVDTRINVRFKYFKEAFIYNTEFWQLMRNRKVCVL